MVLFLVGCSEDQSQSNNAQNEKQAGKEGSTKPVWKDKSKDAFVRAEAYAVTVSGKNNTGPCPLGPGEVGKTGTFKETFACLGNAAFAGCFEALQGKKWIEEEWRREYPEKLMIDHAREAFDKCRAVS